VTEVGPEVWRREHVMPTLDRLVEQRERYHVVRVERHQVAPRVDLAAENVHGHRWWTPAELAATDERIAPPELAELLASL
jgi:hypothetical protein